MQGKDGQTIPPVQREHLDRADLELLREHLSPKYTIDRKIGAGGMADVYFGRHTLLHRNVAIKVLPRIYCRDEMLVKRFMQEAENSARLDHPNIIKIYDIGIHWPLHFFIMAYAPGGTLKDRLRTKGKLDPGAAARIVSAISHGLQYAHDKGVIHRDIKPDNVMFDEDGHPILTDFGIAKAKFATRMTATGTLIGTPHYMSPEQLRGQEVDNRSDIYSLGIMFYEVLTGHVPFDASDTYGIGLKHIQEAPVPPMQCDPSIPEPLSNLILTMLAKSPDARFQHAGEVAYALQSMFDRSGGFKVDPEKVAELSKRAQSAVETSRLNTQQLQEQFALLKETLDRTKAAGDNKGDRVLSNTLTAHHEPTGTVTPAAPTVLRESAKLPESPFTRKTVEIPIEEMRQQQKPGTEAEPPHRLPLIIGAVVVAAVVIVVLVIVFFPKQTDLMPVEQQVAAATLLEPTPATTPEEEPVTDLPGPPGQTADSAVSASADTLPPAGVASPALLVRRSEEAAILIDKGSIKPKDARPAGADPERNETPKKVEDAAARPETNSEHANPADDLTPAKSENIPETDGQTREVKNGNGQNPALRIYESTAVDIKPTVKFRGAQEIPPKARFMKRSGQVIVRLLINTDGSFEVIKVLDETPSNFGFAEAALKYLASSDWQPAKLKGVPVRAYHNVILRFDAH